jgi:hypothetical protein
MNAKYNFGGISMFLGVFKVRVGQGDMATRIKSMLKKGHTEIDMIEFDRKMTKADICTELLKNSRFKKFEAVINETFEKKTAVKVAKKTKVVTAKAVKPAKKAAEKPAKPSSKKTKKEKEQEALIEKAKEEDFEIEELKQLVA